ncbi:orotate phosphoribosyltransferase [Legionella spiritensis]|uniref:Orotate phosphoribosyltransferase n=1 Tax=Legionella spiritensis TaxID=452 RepID=A0A0W0Z2K0_LEGSP|nr:orotate phosphoribosyltransferase [Legionella spiritensis]KTD63351.1 orotate phosphoribosyltransferase [Legionella spiritensis]SNV35423.1 orotate phosphoribosyltransferase [Legionella spiritensis]
MEYSKPAFIRMALACDVLKFGEFTLKSGRKSPYFFNAGMFYQGDSLRHIGHFYAKTLLDNQIEFQHLFGPAYKGLPLATATAIALAERGVNTTVTFNRKETKDHGEGGQLIGAPLQGNTVMIDDVISAGTAFRESQEHIKAHGGNLTTVVIAMNRCERGITDRSAVDEIEAQGIKVLSVITFFDLVDYLIAEGADREVERMKAYQKQYGYNL